MNVAGAVQQAKRMQAERMSWWTEAKFGMFIHWGLYALPGEGEWHMYGSKIPVAEYESLAEQFNPVRFNAREWVRLARQAGMKYIVITAKHHDGFAMYGSQAEPFNIVDATPFQRDPMKELAQACQEEGIRLCFYYSHVIDWHHPHSVHQSANNIWDYKMEEKQFDLYWNELVKPQLRELLTEYGPIGLIWFDTAGGLSKEDSEDIVAHVRRLQPDCLINSRVSHYRGMGDYQSKGDNETPMYGEESQPWETPMTLNETWGYCPKDQVWKTADSLIRKLVNIVSKGGNLLLNVGPSPKGTIPEPAVERLREIGTWTERNAEAIYGTAASPFPYEFDWGAVTAKPGRLFLHVFNDKWPRGHLKLQGMRSRVLKAYLLADPLKRVLPLTHTYHGGTERHTLSVSLPDTAPDQSVSVIVLEVEDVNDLDTGFTVLPSGMLKVDVTSGEVTKADGLGDGTMAARRAAWDIAITEPGTYSLSLISFKRADGALADSYAEGIRLTFAGETIETVPQEDSIIAESPACQHPYKEVHSRLANVFIPVPGTYELTLTSTLIKDRNPRFTEIWQADKVKLRSVMLERADSQQR
ncbi:alpha-L-fucosidase [Paenibacillus thiaminolyticus]|uniref:alpha-L-fucosidase n=1 Tax=Paenibacillus thiaminolyticus TaxID=49283 RepID=A0AAP9DRW0_PANTH|nr:alpha-L-fucosidase [Paenibacillus thiaminolyticus]MCY9536892.1 alpha-L-fucosidase [Paenibacillus thiaminolyticus]MCY9605088.1 alpha-L-fucosidase [Paenibacillus thiaminolyticus]MCY9607225.1 alpha-L-fucosidase [Paenibacillus thiaminolyticus]MCY9616349.1 alpha-L-fucosidase [Paenibacillus thiaminolyticus]MCY9619998.1 alpha-L-fucosidase [Paenibacillus thiaminolyticus]